MIKDIKHYFYRHKLLKNYDIYKYFFNPPEEAKIYQTYNHMYLGHEHLNNSVFKDEFVYFIISDPYIHSEKSINNFKELIKQINRIMPSTFIIIGNFTESKRGDDNYENDIKLFHTLLYNVNKKINILLCGGNNDLNDCNDDELNDYKKHYGDDYYQYWNCGLNIYILNNFLFKSNREELKENQFSILNLFLDWFEEEMFISKIGSTHLMLIMNNDFNVSDNTFLNKNDIEKYLPVIKRSGVQIIFSSCEEERDEIILPLESDDSIGTRLISIPSFNKTKTIYYVKVTEEKQDPKTILLDSLDGLEIDLEKGETYTEI